MEKGGLGGQKETSQHKRLRDVEGRGLRPKLHVNVVLKRKQTNKEKQIFNDEMYYFLDLLKKTIYLRSKGKPNIKRNSGSIIVKQKNTRDDKKNCKVN